VTGGSGMTCRWIRPNVRHIGILHLVSSLTISPQSTCHSAPVFEILSKSDQPRQKKITSCRFSRWRIPAIMDFRGPIMGYLKSPCTASYRLSIDTIFAFWRQDPRWWISAILDFRGLIMGYLKSPCATSYKSSIDTVALNCLVFEKIEFLQFGDRQTDKNRRTDRQERCMKPLSLSRAAA